MLQSELSHAAHSGFTVYQRLPESTECVFLCRIRGLLFHNMYQTMPGAVEVVVIRTYSEAWRITRVT